MISRDVAAALRNSTVISLARRQDCRDELDALLGSLEMRPAYLTAADAKDPEVRAQKPRPKW